MGWFSKAAKTCENRGYEVLDYVPDDGYIFLKKDGLVVSITESGISQWIEEDENSIKQ